MYSFDMINEEIARIFSEIADMLEVLNESVFRIRAYRRAAETIRGLGFDLAKMHWENDEGIEKISGIGKDLHAKIVEIVETGRCEMHERLVKKLSPGILDVLRVRGIGPKKVKLFYEQLGVDSLEKLHAAAASGALATLPGMGEKSEARILESLNQSTWEQRRVPYAEALEAAEKFIKHMKKCKELEQIEYAGSLRRKAETIGDVDLLVTGSDAAKISSHFLQYPLVKEVLADGATKSSVVLKGDIQVDLRVVDAESWGAALFYFTGPKHYNIDVRTIAMRKGWKINEYGLFDGEKLLASKTEQEICEKLGVPYLEPEERV
jgi:DNA polymerase (family 10)